MQSVFTALRPRHALLVAVGLSCALAPAFVSVGCGPEAIGVEACRKIEAARCEAAASCGFAKEDVDDCKLIYTDQCLHGIENTEHRPTTAEADACVAAVKATGACAAAGVKTMAECADVELAAAAGPAAPALAPCDIVLSLAHDLEACSFAVAGADAGGTTSTTTDTADADAATD